MKNLIGKSLAGITLAGALAFGGCKNNLSEYNKENKKVYGDFAKFCYENPNKTDGLGLYKQFSLFDKYRIMFIEEDNSIWDLSVYVKDGDDNFFDYELNGLDNFLVDGFISNKEGKRNHEFIRYMPIKKQLSVSEKYTTALKKIMHESNYRGY